MIKEIRFSDEFSRAFKRLKKRYRSLPNDLKQLLASLVENPNQGVELYNGMRKVRLNFASICCKPAAKYIPSAAAAPSTMKAATRATKAT